MQANQNYKRTGTFKSSKMQFIKKNKFKIVYEINCAQKQSSRGVCSPRKMVCKHKANSQENNHAETRSQQSRFSTSLKSHPHTGCAPKIRKTPAEHPSPIDHLWETVFVYQKSLN